MAEMNPAFYDAKQPSNELMEELQGAPTDRVAYLKHMAKTSILFLAKGILGYKDVNAATHGSYCKFFEECQKLRRLGLMPRGHLKTTLATITDSVRQPLIDVDETRILVLNEGFSGAANMVDEIKGHFEKNKLLRLLFPEVIPEKFAGPGVDWGRGSATLRRKTVYKESTWTAGGVGSALVGGHYNRIKPDDLIGLEAYNSDAKMQEAITFIKVIEPLVTDHHTDIIDYTGTRWKLHDLYGFLMQFYKSRLAVFAREAVENEQIIFPQKHTWEEYKTLQEDSPETWYAQYCNNPMAAGQTDFPPGAIREFRFSLDGKTVELLKGDRRVTWRVSQLDKVMTCDPNGGQKSAPDEAAISVQGITPDDDVLVLQDYGARPTPSEYVDDIYTIAQKWQVRVCGIEQVAQQTTLHYFTEKAKQTDYYLRIEPLKPGRGDKPTRIRRSLEPVIRSRRLYLLATQTQLRQQIDLYPQVKNDDRIDALHYGPKLWRKPLREEDEEENEKVLKLVSGRRSSRTGY